VFFLEKEFQLGRGEDYFCTSFSSIEKEHLIYTFEYAIPILVCL